MTGSGLFCSTKLQRIALQDKLKTEINNTTTNRPLLCMGALLWCVVMSEMTTFTIHVATNTYLINNV